MKYILNCDSKHNTYFMKTIFLFHRVSNNFIFVSYCGLKGIISCVFLRGVSKPLELEKNLCYIFCPLVLYNCYNNKFVNSIVSNFIGMFLINFNILK